MAMEDLGERTRIDSGLKMDPDSYGLSEPAQPVISSGGGKPCFHVSTSMELATVGIVRTCLQPHVDGHGIFQDTRYEKHSHFRCWLCYWLRCRQCASTWLAKLSWASIVAL